MSSARSFLASAVVALGVSLAACSTPELPTVKPLSGRVVGINTTGLEIEAKLEAYNPNDFDIQVKSYTATITIDRTIDAGTVTSQQTITLPANKKKVIDVPMNVKWNDATALAPLALSNRDVPWEANGKVKIGGSLDVELPFKVSGTLTHQQISQAVSRSLPKIPGLPF